MFKTKRKRIIFILVCLIILSSIWLIPSGMPWAHDISYHYSRLIGLTKTIRNGDFIALIHDILGGYGYASGLFYANTFFYFPTILSLFGISYLNSYKIFYLVINIVQVLISYKCFNRIIKDKRYSIFTTIIYTVATYKVMDLLVRGATGENLAFIFIPIIILGLYELIYNDYKKWYIFTIGFVLLLLSHLITTIFIAIISFIFIVFNIRRFLKEKERIKYFILSAVFILLFGAFFIFPIIEAIVSKNIKILTEGSAVTNPYDYRVKLIDFFATTDILIKNIGYGIYILFPVLFIIRKEKHKRNNELDFARLLVIIGILCMISTTCLFPWKYIGKYLTFIQFPWRLLIVATPFISLGVGIYAKNIVTKKHKKIVNILYIISICISSLIMVGYVFTYTFIMPRYNSFPYYMGTYEYIIKGTDINMASDLLSYEEAEKDYYITNNNNLKFSYKKHGKRIEIKYKNNDKNNTYIEVPLFNYAGYKVIGAKHKNGTNNVIRVVLTKKQGKVKIYYDMTIIQKISYIISLISVVGFILYYYKKKKRKLIMHN